MPIKINMFITNGNFIHPSQKLSSEKLANLANLANLATIDPALSVKPFLSALNTSIIGRIHTVKPGCGSCGRH
jgi:hypothetical protein